MPTRGDVHVNAPLTNISVAFIQDERNFIADKVFPTVPVQKQSDRYFVYGREDFFRDEAEERAPGTESAGGDYSIDNTPTYYCREYGFHKDIDDGERTNSDNPLKPDEDATIFVTQKMLIRRERSWAANYFTTGKWGANLNGGASGGGGDFVYWDDYDHSDPITDIETRKDTIALTGFKPNTLVLGAQVFTKLKSHPKILDRVKYTQRGVITEEILAALFGIDRVLVPYAVVNVAAKNKTGSYQFIHGKHALLVYAAPNPGIKVPSGGYTFAWTGMYGAGAYGNRIRQFRMENLRSDRVEGEIAFDCKQIAADLGVFFNGAIS